MPAERSWHGFYRLNLLQDMRRLIDDRLVCAVLKTHMLLTTLGMLLKSVKLESCGYETKSHILKWRGIAAPKGLGQRAAAVGCCRRTVSTGRTRGTERP